MKHEKGILIALEGGEGGGKTTQIVRLTTRFKKAGKDVVSVREPGGTVISEQIREVVLSHKNIGMQDTTEVLLFQAARAQIYGEVVIPALKAGKIVLMDRTSDSSVVYQGMVRGFGRKLIEQLNEISTQKTTPDLTILLDVSVKIGLERRNGSGKIDRLDMEAADFHEQVRQAYLSLAKENAHKRWITVNAEQSEDEVEKALWQIISKKLSL
ncbi:MAG: dTMP kinase [Candidatus Pacebacteria bacterium RIFOXYB1_FULL_39_46]|nr:MAG: dTMP kinase [Candidatus Pacebacteria bacterium RIFOXYA1_FULL_38_18]OGJ38456.1 MAG: dTMP kinase [Candidatus Pacebacteria bacterium RIFOXYB1_FULL_39_46]OGJ40316.1 MAG: dTMP kinase [Candidatus Pacebacteria bacterium RIFOXYC1_FULL_39_21]OGJ40889.1 MAG: dTMP kinase [Candidatus Pacebacteria bacterium RIFOXYD1_FULL_39_27]